MTNINPTYLNPGPQNLETLLLALKTDIMKNINCAKVGIIQSFNATLQEVVVQIAFQQVTSTNPDGTRTLAEYPLLLNVPAQFCGGGGFTNTFPVTAGDECLVIFNDRQIDNWLISGGGQPPTIGRLHDLSDGLAILGFRSNPRALANVSTSSAQMRSDDGATVIDIAQGKIQLIADEVVIHARNKATFDAGGTGFVYQVGQIDTYTDGVTSHSHPPHPPEVPT